MVFNGDSLAIKMKELLLYCATSKVTSGFFSIGATHDASPSLVSALHIKPNEPMVMNNRLIIDVIN